VYVRFRATSGSCAWSSAISRPVQFDADIFERILLGLRARSTYSSRGLPNEADLDALRTRHPAIPLERAGDLI